MRTEKRDVYICEYCGEAFLDKSCCEEHERVCVGNVEVVRVTMFYYVGEPFSFKQNIEFIRRDTYTKYEEVFGYDEDCDCFVIVSQDTSEEHIKELKTKLIERAKELVKETRDNYHEYYEDLLKELNNLNKKEDK